MTKPIVYIFLSGIVDILGHISIHYAAAETGCGEIRIRKKSRFRYVRGTDIRHVNFVLIHRVSRFARERLILSVVHALYMPPSILSDLSLSSPEGTSFFSLVVGNKKYTWNFKIIVFRSN